MRAATGSRPSGRSDGPADLLRCVFHQKTAAHAGIDALLSLSALRKTDPATYERALAKYDDTPERRRLPSTVIPGLHRLWTEVVFLSPIQPHAIWRAWTSARGKPLPSQKFWAIPVEDVAPAVLLDRRLTRTGEAIDPAEVEPLDPATYRSADRTTPENLRWIEALAARGRKGAWFHGTPHVLTAGPVPLGRARVVDWADGADTPALDIPRDVR